MDDPIVSRQGLVRATHTHACSIKLTVPASVVHNWSRSIERWQAAVVMVLSTPEAEAICQKSGMSVTDLFRPYNVMSDLDGMLSPRSFGANCSPRVLLLTLGLCDTADVQTVGDRYRLRSFEVRFVHASELRYLQPGSDPQRQPRHPPSINPNLSPTHSSFGADAVTQNAHTLHPHEIHILFLRSCLCLSSHPSATHA